MDTAALWLTIGLLLTHELDAVRCREWRVLPLTSWLPDKTGEAVFLWAHVPLVMLVIWIAGQGASSLPALGFSGFAILHVGLHWVFRNHPEYAFKDLTSQLLILLPGGAGALHSALWLLGP